MWGFLIACISGALMSIQGVFNTGVTKETGPWITNCFVQLTGFFVCVGFFLFMEQGKIPIGDLFKVNHKYMLLGGVIGAFITVTVIQSMGKLGPAQATMLIVIAQLTISWLIELCGMFGVERADFSMRKLMGLLVAIAGVVLFEWE